MDRWIKNKMRLISRLLFFISNNILPLIEREDYIMKKYLQYILNVFLILVIIVKFKYHELILLIKYRASLLDWFNWNLTLPCVEEIMNASMEGFAFVGIDDETIEIIEFDSGRRGIKFMLKYVDILN